MSDVAIAVSLTLVMMTVAGAGLTFIHFRRRYLSRKEVDRDLAARSQNHDTEAQTDPSQAPMTNIQRSNARRTKNHAGYRPATHQQPPQGVVLDDAGPSQSSDHLTVNNRYYTGPNITVNVQTPARAHIPKNPAQSARPKRIKVQVELDEASTQCSEPTEISLEPITSSKKPSCTTRCAPSSSEHVKKVTQLDTPKTTSRTNRHASLSSEHTKKAAQHTPDYRLTWLRYKYDHLIKTDYVHLVSGRRGVDVKRARQLIKQIHELSQDSEKIAPVSASDDLKKAKEASRTELNRTIEKLGDYIRT